MRIPSTKPAVHVAIVKADQEIPDPTLSELVKSNTPVGAVDDEVMAISRKLLEQQAQPSAAQAFLTGDHSGFFSASGMCRVGPDAFDRQRFGGHKAIVPPLNMQGLGLADGEDEALKLVAEMGTKALKDLAKEQGYGLHVGGITTLWQGANAVRTWNEQGLTWESAELAGKTLSGGLSLASGLFPGAPYLKTASNVAQLLVMAVGIVSETVQDEGFDAKQDVDKMLIAFSRPAG